MKRYPAFSLRISGAALLIVFTVVMGLADVWLVAWWIGSVWGSVVAAGTSLDSCSPSHGPFVTMFLLADSRKV